MSDGLRLPAFDESGVAMRLSEEWWRERDMFLGFGLETVQNEESAESVTACGGKSSGVAQSGEQPGNPDAGHGPGEYGKVAGSSPATGRTVLAPRAKAGGGTTPQAEVRQASARYGREVA